MILVVILMVVRIFESFFCEFNFECVDLDIVLLYINRRG